MEAIHKKVRGKKLIECPDLKSMVDHAWDVVQTHCKVEFDDSWQSIASLQTGPITEEIFFKNYLWCVYVSGFSAKVVTAKFDGLLMAHNLVNAHGIFVPSEKADPPSKEKVFMLWKNHAKFNAIFNTRLQVRDGWVPFRQKFLDGRDPLSIERLPFMGPALSRHLARNLGGTHVVKPDVHLVRLAQKFVPNESSAVESVERLCHAATESLDQLKGWPLGKVDLLLWYASATLRS